MIFCKIFIYALLFNGYAAFLVEKIDNIKAFLKKQRVEAIEY